MLRYVLSCIVTRLGEGKALSLIVGFSRPERNHVIKYLVIIILDRTQYSLFLFLSLSLSLSLLLIEKAFWSDELHNILFRRICIVNKIQHPVFRRTVPRAS